MQMFEKRELGGNMPAKKVAAPVEPAKLKITLTASLIGSKPAKRATAQSLGLRKIGDAIVIADLPSTHGKIRVLSHLVSVETV